MSAPKYLIARLSALGDVVCSLPAAVALKKSFPECAVTWVVDPRFAEVVECCAAVDTVVQFNPKSAKVPVLHEGFEAALDLQGLLKSALPVLFASAKTKVGYHWQREGAGLASRRVLPDPTSHHVVDQYVDVARFLGAEMDRAEFQLNPKPASIASVRAKVQEAGVDGRFVVVNPGAGWPTKKWDPAKLARLIDRMAEQGVKSVLIGGRGDQDQASASDVKQACGSQPADLVGKTGIGELIALLSLSQLHVGGDTGSTHIAAALGVPAIGLYGITDPKRSCPYGQVGNCFYDPFGIQNIPFEPVAELAARLVPKIAES